MSETQLFWLYVWLFPGLWFALTELITSRPFRPLYAVFAGLSGALWPLTLPLSVWVAFNPQKAERIRRRFGAKP